jgi:hypothetical protein
MRSACAAHAHAQRMRMRSAHVVHGGVCVVGKKVASKMWHRVDAKKKRRLSLYKMYKRQNYCHKITFRPSGYPILLCHFQQFFQVNSTN